jgi:cytochrome P450
MMSHDTRHYKNSEVFNPDCFLDNKPELDPRAYAFGFGRRVCPGCLFKEATVFLAVSKALTTLKILKVRDNTGDEITPTLEYGDGILRQAFVIYLLYSFLLS